MSDTCDVTPESTNPRFEPYFAPPRPYFAENANGGGAWYPTNLTVAYAQAAAMTSGWNNRVSSVYIT